MKLLKPSEIFALPTYPMGNQRWSDMPSNLIKDAFNIHGVLDQSKIWKLSLEETPFQVHTKISRNDYDSLYGNDNTFVRALIYQGRYFGLVFHKTYESDDARAELFITDEKTFAAAKEYVESFLFPQEKTYKVLAENEETDALSECIDSFLVKEDDGTIRLANPHAFIQRPGEDSAESCIHILDDKKCFEYAMSSAKSGGNDNLEKTILSIFLQELRVPAEDKYVIDVMVSQLPEDIQQTEEMKSKNYYNKCLVVLRYQGMTYALMSSTYCGVEGMLNNYTLVSLGGENLFEEFKALKKA